MHVIMRKPAIEKAYNDPSSHYSCEAASLSPMVRRESHLNSDTPSPSTAHASFRLKIAAMASPAACDNRNIMGDQDLL